MKSGLEGSRLDRVFGIAVASVAVASVNMVGSLLAFQASLDPDDGAYSNPLWSILSDSLVLDLAIPVTGFCALIGFLFGVPTLYRTRLRATVPIVLVTSLLATTTTSIAGLAPLAPMPGLLIGIATMYECRSLSRRRGSRFAPRTS